MSYKVVIDNSASTLLQLLCIALKGQAIAVLNEADWLEVLSLAQKQGV